MGHHHVSSPPLIESTMRSVHEGDPTPGMRVIDAYNEGVRRQKIGDKKGAVS